MPAHVSGKFPIRSAGHYGPFVVWFNFLAGFAYVVAGFGLWFRRRWAAGLVDGAKRVRIFGQDVPVRASIHTLGGFSAHADQAALLNWLGAFKRSPSQTFVMHGEAHSSATFASEITRRLGWDTQTPDRGETVIITPADAERQPR
tara:strand:- start:59 stop:493 length:435 start_codon:yes stop_codon:yes gene_type:complete